jgi:hypothetical protein
MWVMQIVYRLITPPSDEPVTLGEAKAWLKVDHVEEDALIQNLITTARERFETLTGQSLMIQQWRAYLAYWPLQMDDHWWDGVREGAYTWASQTRIDLLHGPVRQIDSFFLFDAEGNETVYPAEHYLLDKVRDQLVLKTGAPLPQGERAANPIEITYTVGYESIPGVIKTSLLKLVTHLFEHRGDENFTIPKNVLSLWLPYRKVKL